MPIHQRIKNLLAVLLTFAMLAAVFRDPAPDASAARLAGIAGSGSTGIQITNLDAANNATAVVDFYKQGGGAPVARVIPSIAPNQSFSIFLPAEASIGNGAYAAVVSADRPITTLTRTVWQASGGGLTHGDVEPSTEVIVPSVVKSYAGQSSLINIQNTDTGNAATATVELMASGSTAPSATTTLAIGPGTSATLDITKHAAFSTIPDGFLGWARVTAGVPLAVLSYTDMALSQRGVYPVDGIPAENAAATLFAPMVTNDLGGLTSGLMVLNPAATPVQVTVTYTGIGGACSGQTIAHDTATIAAGAQATFYQGDISIPGTGRSHLPTSCAATAKIAATGGAVMAIANLVNLSEDTSAAYPALRASRAGSQVMLPLMRRHFYGTTAVHAVNTSASDATVTLEYSGTTGGGSPSPYTSCGAGCQVTIPAGGGHRWDMDSLAGFTDKSYGSARLISDQPLLATVLDRCDATCNQQSRANDGAFNGVAMGAAPGDPAAMRRHHVPLALRVQGDPPPTPTAGPPPATAPATATSTGPQPPTATPGSGGTGGGMRGAGISGIQVANLSRTDSADITLTFRRHPDGPPVAVSRPGVPAGRAANTYLPAEAGLQNGVHAARVSANQPIDAIMRTDWSNTGGAVIGNASEAGTELILPLLLRRYNGQTSVLAIQSIDSAAVTQVTLQIFQAGTTTPLKTLVFPVTPLGAINLDLGADPSFDDLPSGLLAWARLSAGTPIAATSLVNMGGTAKGVYDVAAVPTDRAATKLGAPMLFNAFAAYDGSLTSGISVLNPGTSPVHAKVTYRGAGIGADNACPNQTIEHNGGAAVTIAPAAIAVFYQGNVEVPGTGPSGLPEGCAVSAVIETVGGGVVAVVNVTNVTQGSSGAYAAVAPSQGAGRVQLPLVRREHTGGKLTTVVQAQNLGDTPANVTLTVWDSSGQAINCGGDCTATIPPGGGRMWWPTEITAWQPGTYGSAQLDSDQPIAAVVDDLSFAGANDQAIYLGLAEGAGNAADLPLLLKSARIGSAPPPAPTAVGPATPTPGGSPQPTATPSPGGILNLAGASGIQVMNLSQTSAADLSLVLTNHSTGASTTLTRPSVAPGASAVLYLPAEPTLPSGVFAARISANQPIAALARSDWTSTGHALMYNAPSASTDLLVPILYKGYTTGQSSIVSIQNTDPSNAATVLLELFPQGQVDPVATLTIPLLGAGGATSLSLDTHPQLGSIAGGTYLWGRVNADRPVAVTVTIPTANSAKGVYSVAGVPTSDAAARLHVPMVFKGYQVVPGDPAAGSLTTGITMLNPGPNPVSVTMTYHGADIQGRGNACQGQTIVHASSPLVIPPGGVNSFYPPTASQVPSGCAASGVLDVTGGSIVAFAHIANMQQGTSAAYGAVAASEGSQRVELPLVRREHTAAKLTTPIQVQNLGESAANVTLTIKDSTGTPVACGAACTAAIPPGGSRLWWPTDIAAWAANSYGSAVVTSDQPVAAVVDDMSFTGFHDMATYVGLTDRGESEAVLPLVLNGGRLADVPPIVGPTPTPTPAPPLVGLPASMPAPVDGRISVPVSFDSGDYQVAELELTLDYDQSWLRFDTTDGDGDGLPDAVGTTLPAGFTVTVQHDAAVVNAELVIRVSSLAGTPQALPSGSWLTLRLDVTGKPGPRAGGLSFGPNKGIRLRDLEGGEIAAGRVAGGWSPNSQRVVHLPALFRN